MSLAVPPQIVNISSDITVNEGSSVTLMCLAFGRPEPTVTWRHLSGKGESSLGARRTSRPARGARRDVSVEAAQARARRRAAGSGPVGGRGCWGPARVAAEW